MANLFDAIQTALYNTVVNAMGVSAVWTPSDGSPAQTGAVLFNKPTQREDVSDDEYDAIATKCEYLEGLFPGLFEAVQAARSELINIDGADYYAYKADRKFDGKTIIIKVEPKRQ